MNPSRIVSENIDQQYTSNSNLLLKSQDERLNRTFIAAMIAGTTVFGTVALMAPFALGYIRSPLPYMATPSHKVEKALRYVVGRKQKAALHSAGGKPRLVLIDLGSGDGETVYQAVQLGYTKAIGIELNFTLYCISQFRRYFLWSSEQRKRTAFYCQDFFHVSPSLIAEADTIMIFGVPSIMKRISRTLRRYCLSGTHILSYRFPLPTVDNPGDQQRKSDSELSSLQQASFKRSVTSKSQGKESDEMEDLSKADLIYEESEMRVYECQSKSA